MTTGKKVGLGCLGFIVLVVILSSLSQSPNSRNNNFQTATTQSPATTSPAQFPKEIALRSAKLDFKWTTGGFGNIMKADFTIQNIGNYAIKDIEITCTHFANSGTRIDSNVRTIYEAVAAHGKKTIKDFNMGFIHSQATSSHCEITDLEIIQ